MDARNFGVPTFVEGEDLERTLARCGSMSWAQARRVMLQICEALATIHRSGAVRGDLKPANCLCLGEDRIKLLGFGVSALVQSRPDSHGRETRPDPLRGTPEYMSPELARDDPLTARSDIYSAGAVLFHLLTGRPPFDGKSPLAIVTKHLHKQPASLQSMVPAGACIDPRVEEIVRRALAKEPRDRFATAAAMAEALRAVPAEEPSGERSGQARSSTQRGMLARLGAAWARARAVLSARGRPDDARAL